MSLADLIKTASGPLKPGVWKRHNRESDEDDNNSNIKKPRYWYVTLENESPIPTDDSDSESIYSVQDEETEFARDTSDTSTSAWISTSAHRNMQLQVEYDVASTSESDNPFLNVSSSDPEDFITVTISSKLGETDLDLDLDRVEDTDESLTSLDSEISRADYWTCIQCNTTNNNPLFRYCEKCYQLRKNFFPPRPKRKKRRHGTAITTARAEAEPSSSLPNTEVISRIDSGLGSSQSAMSEVDGDSAGSSQPTMVLSQEESGIGDTVDGIVATNLTRNQRDTETKGIKSMSERDITPLINDKELKKTELASNEFNNKMELMQKKLKSDEDNDNKYCLVCTVSPKDGAFVHGNVSHICCCYRCAVKVWKTTRHCPICQRKVTNVLKAFYV